MAFNKTGAGDGKTLSTHDPKTGVTKTACPKCDQMLESTMTKQAYVAGEAAARQSGHTCK